MSAVMSSERAYIKFCHFLNLDIGAGRLTSRYHDEPGCGLRSVAEGVDNIRLWTHEHPLDRITCAYSRDEVKQCHRRIHNLTCVKHEVSLNKLLEGENRCDTSPSSCRSHELY